MKRKQTNEGKLENYVKMLKLTIAQNQFSNSKLTLNEYFMK